jgi:protease-4
VAEGRQTTPDAVDRVARGRIWTGRQAFDIGLVDKLGNLEQTVAAAAARAGLETWTLKPITRPLGFQEQLLKQLAEGGAGLAWQTLASGDPLLSLATSLRRELAQLRRLNDPQGVYLQCFGCPHL